MRKKSFLYLIASFTVLVFCSCVDENDFDVDRIARTTLKPTVEANLIDVDFYLSDFFSFDSITDEKEGVELVTVYDANGNYDYMQIEVDKNFSISEEDIVDFNTVMEIPDVELNLGSVYIPALGGITGTYTLASNQDASIIVAPFEPVEEHRQIDSAWLSNADIRVATSSALPVTLKLVIYSSSIKSPAGETLRDTLVLSSTSLSDVVELNNYRVYLDKMTGSDSSKIDLKYDLLAEMETATVAGNYDLDLSLSFANGQLGLWDIALAYGKVGSLQLDYNDTVFINYFSGEDFAEIVKPGDFDFEDMFMNLEVRTNIGLGCDVDFSSLITESAGELKHNLINGTQGLFLNRAPNPNTESVTTYSFGKNTERTINTTAFEMLPDKLIYNLKFNLRDVDTLINGVHYPSFVYPTSSYINVNSHFIVPLKAKIMNLSTVQDIGDMKFLQEDGGVGDYLESVDLMIELTNSFPADLDFNIVLRKDDGTVYDTILDAPVHIASATVDNEGKVGSATNTSFTRRITKEKYEALRDAEKVGASIILNTGKSTDGTQHYIKFDKDSKVNLKLRVKANTAIGFDL